MSWLVRVAASIVIVGFAIRAQAAEEPSQEARERAREAYGQGQEFFAAGQYEQALAAFQSAFEAIPNPIVLLSIGETQKKLGKAVEAVESFEGYLALKPDASDRAAVEQKIAELRSLPATLAIASYPQGAAIRIDGEDTGKVTPAEVEVPPGEHVVTLSLDGFSNEHETVQAGFGIRLQLAVPMTAESVEEDLGRPTATTDDMAAVAASESSVLPWIVIGVGGAAVVTGGVLGLLALSKHDDFEAEPTEEAADSGERLALFADVAFGVGLAALVTGWVLLVLPEHEAGEDAAASGTARAARLRLMPGVHGDGAGMWGRLQF